MAEELKKSLRTKMIEEQMDRVARLTPRTPRVRVSPKNDMVRQGIRHMPTGIPFPASGSVEWPYDNFTQRRIHDGTVIQEGKPIFEYPPAGDVPFGYEVKQQTPRPRPPIARQPRTPTPPAKPPGT
jgi:hypothetical protein